MADNPDRFVIIDGVQISRERAKRKGLIDNDGNVLRTAPNETRARTQNSARRPEGRHAEQPPVVPASVAQVGDGAVSTGEDAARAGQAEAVAPAGVDDASATPAPADGSAPVEPSTSDASPVAVDDASAAPAEPATPVKINRRRS